MSRLHVCRVRAYALAGALLLSCLAGAPAARAGSYNFVTVDYGGGYETTLYGINDDGLLAGILYNPTTNLNTGVIFSGGVGTLVVAPNAIDTELYQVNNAGQFAVSYYGADDIYHAAVYNSSSRSWTDLPDVPNYAENLAGGINNHGIVAGDPFVNNSYVGGVGWTWNGSKYTFFSAPGADPAKLGTATYSINDAGQVVGYVQDSSGNIHGFIMTGSSFTLLDAPGADGDTTAQGINNLGVVTGYYLDASGAYNGFVWDNGKFTTVNVPGAMGTDITGINDQGDLVGWYLDAAGTAHGFEAFSVPEPGTATLMVTGLVTMVLSLRRRGAGPGRRGRMIGISSFSRGNPN